MSSDDTPATVPGPAPAPAPDRSAAGRRKSLTNSQIFLTYYKENDVFFSVEGILKLISIVVCVVLCVVVVVGGAEGAGAAAGGAALAAAAAPALVVCARALRLHAAAPHLCLLLDIVLCSVSGALLLVCAALCRPRPPARYLHGVLSLCASALLIASASLMYSGAMRTRDAALTARTPRVALPPRAGASPLEHHV